MRRTLVYITVLVLDVALVAAGAFAAMEDYCVVPPYVIQNVPPNVMLLLDNSDSMFKFAYSEEICPNAVVRSKGSYPDYARNYPSAGGLSLGDLIYFGQKTDELYFPTTRQVYESFDVGDYVYLLVYDYRYWDCTADPADYPTLPTAVIDGQTCVYTLDYTRYWRGVRDDDRLRIGSISGQFNPTVTLVDGAGNPLTIGNMIDEYRTVFMVKASCSVVDDGIDSMVNNAIDWAVKDSSFDPAKTYYGYFSSSHWYTYGASKFTPTDPKPGTEITDARAKLDNEWDGNFLNWLTMRRIDVLRRATTGGRTASGGSTPKRVAAALPQSLEYADIVHHGLYKWVEEAESYVSTTYLVNSVGMVAPGPRCFHFPPKKAAFQVDQNVDANCSPESTDIVSGYPLGTSSYGSEISLTQIEALPGEEVEGVLQKIVGARARIGLTWLEESINQGGVVVEDMGGQSLENVINAINNPINFNAGTKAPLAEALWTVTGYFANKGDYANPNFIDKSGPSTISEESTGPDYGSSYGNFDPMNFGTAGHERYPKCAENYVLMVTDGNPCRDGSLPDNIIKYAHGGVDRSIFDCGKPNANEWICPAKSDSGYSFPRDAIFESSAYNVKPWIDCPWDGAANGIPVNGARAGLEDVALYAHLTDLRDPAVGTHEIEDKQNIDLYLVNAFGSGSTLLKYAAINGGFEDQNANERPDLQDEWDADGNGEPDNYYSAQEGAELEQAIENAFSSILKRASSGTAASVLASGEDSGANLIQAIFYPRRRFGNKVIKWTGSLQNFWYFVDPFFVNNSIREDTREEDGVHDYKLHMTNDYIAKLYFDEEAQAALAKIYESDELGSAVAHIANVPIEEVDFIWEAGQKLFERDIDSEQRAIYTPNLMYGIYDGHGTYRMSVPPPPLAENGMMGFTNSLSSLYWFFMDPFAPDETETDRVIRYLHGEDIFVDDGAGGNAYRNRTVTISGATGVWKLADILNSTPQITAREKSYIYNGDSGTMDPKFTRTPSTTHYYDAYGDRTFLKYLEMPADDEMSTVFAGANDGMLHAFRLGQVERDWPGQGDLEKNRLAGAEVDGSDLGEEEWAFIPLNALPYLKYYPRSDYCHIYSVDLSPSLFDAAIGADMDLSNNEEEIPDVNVRAAGQPSYCNDTDYYNCIKSGESWRTLLIGGMRYGGGCKGPTETGVSIPDNPFFDPPEQGIGYSSYFALDITDPSDPKFLWEFAAPGLGFASAGPVMVKINGKLDGDNDGVPDTVSKKTNGRWFIVLASGPTGPIETLDHQFMGQSDQNLRYFVLDAKTGVLLRTIDSGITDAFSSSILASTIDPDSDYADDAMYAGYSMKDTTTNPDFTWTKGGVLRLLTKEDMDPNNWVLSEVINEIGPVTAAVQTLGRIGLYEDQVWLYFGSGRYFYDTGSMHDDFESKRFLYGVKDDCFIGDLSAGALPWYDTFDPPCSAAIAEPEDSGPVKLANADAEGVESFEGIEESTMDGLRGWRIGLAEYPLNPDDKNDPDYGFAAERIITDPVASFSTGVVFFTAFRPYELKCGLGGKSAIWAVNAYNAGSPAGKLKGKALVQVSTGVIEEIDLAEAFSDRGGRRSTMLEGVPPMAQGMSMFTQPAPIMRIFQIIER